MGHGGSEAGSLVARVFKFDNIYLMKNVLTILKFLLGHPNQVFRKEFHLAPSKLRFEELNKSTTLIAPYSLFLSTSLAGSTFGTR